jgi:hypothetical protein
MRVGAVRRERSDIDGRVEHPQRRDLVSWDTLDGL